LILLLCCPHLLLLPLHSLHLMLHPFLLLLCSGPCLGPKPYELD
jgi:hypothetical protein